MPLIIAIAAPDDGPASPRTQHSWDKNPSNPCISAPNSLFQYWSFRMPMKPVAVRSSNASRHLLYLHRPWLFLILFYQLISSSPAPSIRFEQIKVFWFNSISIMVFLTDSKIKIPLVTKYRCCWGRFEFAHNPSLPWIYYSIWHLCSTLRFAWSGILLQHYHLHLILEIALWRFFYLKRRTFYSSMRP